MDVGSEMSYSKSAGMGASASSSSSSSSASASAVGSSGSGSSARAPASARLCSSSQGLVSRSTSCRPASRASSLASLGSAGESDAASTTSSRVIQPRARAASTAWWCPSCAWVMKLPPGQPQSCHAARLAFCLTFHTERGFWPGPQPLRRDLLAAVGTDAVLALGQPFLRLLDLLGLLLEHPLGRVVELALVHVVGHVGRFADVFNLPGFRPERLRGRQLLPGHGITPGVG